MHPLAHTGEEELVPGQLTFPLMAGHESYVTFCQLEDEAAFTCSADCTIRKWDVRTGQCLQVYRGHTSIVNRSAKPRGMIQEDRNGGLILSRAANHLW